MFVVNGIKYNTAKEVSELLGVHYKSVPRLAFRAVGYFKIKAQTFIVKSFKRIGYTDEDVESMKKIYHPTKKTVERQKEKEKEKEVMMEKKLELEKKFERGKG